MKPVDIKKLEPFLMKEADIKKSQEEMMLPLCEIHTSDKFSIASDGAIVGVIYNSEDHDLYYEPFGDSMDMVVSLLKQYRDRKDESFKITLNRKIILDIIKEQFKELKAQVKEERKETLRQEEAITRFDIDCEKHQLFIKTYTKYKYDGYMIYGVSTQPELEVDFQQSYRQNIKEWKQGYLTKYITTLLNFFTGYEAITLYQDGNLLHPIRCEEEDREVLLLPFRI